MTQKDGDDCLVTYQYRDVGTNIDCNATSQADGLLQSRHQTERLLGQFRSEGTRDRRSRAYPAFRNFTSNFSILLKDGQTAQYASATDPVSGETLKVDVTINVLK